VISPTLKVKSFTSGQIIGEPHQANDGTGPSRHLVLVASSHKRARLQRTWAKTDCKAVRTIRGPYCCGPIRFALLQISRIARIC
jgi:hypothetical protein